MIVQRLFSIQSGGPDKGGSLKRELAAKAKDGAIFGGALGSIYGAAFGPLAGLADGAKTGLMVGAGFITGGAILGTIVNSLNALGANKRRAKAEGLNMDKLLDYLYNRDAAMSNFKDMEDIKIERYLTEDGDPNKFTVNFSYEDGKLVIYLNKPSDALLKNLNEDLEDIIKHNRKADYAANSVKNGYMVYVICPDIDSAARIIYDVACENRINVNALTEKSLSKAKTQQKQFSSKAQKARLKKLRLSEGRDPLSEMYEASNIASEKDKGIKKTSQKTGKSYESLFKKAQEKTNLSEAAIIRNNRMENRLDSNTIHRDKLADKQTKAGFKSYKDKQNKEISKIKESKRKEAEMEAKKAAESKASIAKHEKKAAELRAKKLARQKLAKNLKTAGIVGGGIAGTVGVGYGIKKAIDKNKKAKREKNEKED